MKNKILILTIAAALPASFTLAQEPGGPRPPGPPPKDGARRPGPRDGDAAKTPDGPRDGQRPPGPMPDPLVRALDTDKDGIISADEIKNASDSLKKLDKNNDGQLTRDEYAPPPPPPPQGDGQRKGGPRDGAKAAGGAPKPTDKKPDDWPFGKDKNATTTSDTKGGADKPAGDPPAKGQRPPPPPSPLLQALDTDGDGTISADEIGKAAESLAKLDKNNDGQLGPREYMPAPPEGQPPRDGGKDGGKAGAKPAQ